MKVLIINSAAAGDLAFIEPILETVESQHQWDRKKKVDVEVCHWTDLKSNQHLASFQAIIISASPMGDNANFQERVQCFHWLKTVHMPVLGICAGHQFIGHVFGSRLIRNVEAEEGITPVRIQSWDPIFAGHAEEISVMQQHHDSITLPDDFVLLARSDRCRVQAIRHTDRPIYGVQWHAEISTPRLIRNLLEIHS